MILKGVPDIGFDTCCLDWGADHGSLQTLAGSDSVLLLTNEVAAMLDITDILLHCLDKPGL